MAVLALPVAAASLLLPFVVASAFVNLRWLFGSLIDALLMRILTAPLYYFLAALAVAVAAVALAVVALGRPAARWHGRGRIPAITALVLGGISLLSAIPGFAFVLPSCLRTNDSMALRDVREIAGTQKNYADSNGGQYGTLECLGAPARCLQGEFYVLPEPAERLVEYRFGHRRTLVLGGPPVAGGTGAGSRPGARTFAYVSVPVRPGLAGTGFRGFCADHTGVTCRLRNPRMPSLENGACPRSECIELPY